MAEAFGDAHCCIWQFKLQYVLTVMHQANRNLHMKRDRQGSAASDSERVRRRHVPHNRCDMKFLCSFSVAVVVHKVGSCPWIVAFSPQHWAETRRTVCAVFQNHSMVRWRDLQFERCLEFAELAPLVSCWYSKYRSMHALQYKVPVCLLELGKASELL